MFAASGEHSLGTVLSSVLLGVLGGKGCSARGSRVGAAGSWACQAGCVACGDACLGSQSIFPNTLIIVIYMAKVWGRELGKGISRFVLRALIRGRRWGEGGYSTRAVP